MKPTAAIPHLVPVPPRVVATGTDDTATRLAARLWRDHGGSPVRALEALAGALANRVRADGADAAGLPWPGDGGRVPAAYRRIARRALSGALGDPVGAATRFHRDGASPPWAVTRLPVAEVGGFLFYETHAVEG